MKQVVAFVVIFGGWFVLQRWILPAFGVPTCMSGACRPPMSRPQPMRPGTDVESESDPPEAAEQREAS